MENTTISEEKVNSLLKRKERMAKGKKISALTFIWIMLLIMYLPIMYLILFSFTESKIIGQWNGFSFASYIRLFSTKYPDSVKIWDAAWNTLWIAVISSTISTILGTSGAIGMHFLGKKLKATFNLATQIPIVNAEIVMALSLVILFAFLGLPTSIFSLIIGHVVLTIPFVVINVQPKLEQMDPSLYEAAMDLGATRFGALFKVMIPDIVPGILAGFMISMTLSLDDYVITSFTKPSNGSDFHTISTYVQGLLVKGSLPIQLRSFTAIIFGLIVVLMIAYSIVNYRKSKKA